ncbi:TonB-dependent receptor [Geofilum sp. OHC36d9]|uniref:TonB-dependent receptor n=1 Tax=Geofilum sp. OHC36d9 TaxID=3458413 RepID=UPI004034442B
MKRSFILLMMLVMTSVVAMSQYRFLGVVTDEQSNPLPGAAIWLDESLATVTNNQGRFEFSEINKGVHALKISFLGYEMLAQDIEINADVNLEFKMTQKWHLTPEVIVSAYRAGDKAPVAYSNKSGNALRSLGTTEDLPYLLQLMPSLVATSESGIAVGSTAFRVRGSDPTRINVTVNGIPLNDSESQGVYWVNMPDFSGSVQEVQVQRGVGTSANGSAAFGATVNFRSGADTTEPFAEAVSAAGSYNTFKNSVKMSTGLINDRFSFEGRYSNVQSDGYIKNAFANHKSLYLSGTMHFASSFLKMNVIHGDQRTGISWWGVPQELLKIDRRYNPAGVYTDINGNEQYYKDQSDNYIQTHYQAFFSHAFSLNSDMTLALHYTRGDGFYEQYKEGESFADYALPNVEVGDQTVETTDLVRQKWMANDFYGFVFSGNQQAGDFLKLSVGGGWNRYDGDHYGKIIWARYASNMEKDYEWYFNNGLKTDYNIFTKLDFDFGAVSFLLDMQYRGVDYEMSGFDDDLNSLDQNHSFNFFNPKAGFFVTVNEAVDAYASFGVANREPTRTNFKDANGDPDAMPQAERLFDWEAGTGFKSGMASFNVNLFYMLYRDQLVPTGEKSNVGYDIMTNVEKSYRAGAELQWGIRPVHFLRWDGNITLSRNKIENYVETADEYDADGNALVRITPLGTTDIAYSPSLVVGSSLAVKCFKGANVTLNSKYVGEQFFDNTSSNDRQLDAYLVHDLKLSYGFTPAWMKQVEISLMVNNLSNLKYESNAYGGNWYEEGVEQTWAYYYPMAPRYYMGQLVLKF